MRYAAAQRLNFPPCDTGQIVRLQEVTKLPESAGGVGDEGVEEAGGALGGAPDRGRNAFRGTVDDDAAAGAGHRGVDQLAGRDARIDRTGTTATSSYSEPCARCTVTAKKLS